MIHGKRFVENGITHSRGLRSEGGVSLRLAHQGSIPIGRRFIEHAPYHAPYADTMCVQIGLDKRATLRGKRIAQKEVAARLPDANQSRPDAVLRGEALSLDQGESLIVRLSSRELRSERQEEVIETVIRQEGCKQVRPTLQQDAVEDIPIRVVISYCGKNPMRRNAAIRPS